MMLARAILLTAFCSCLSFIAHAENLPSSCSNAVENAVPSEIIKQCSKAAKKGNTEAAYQMGKAYDYNPASLKNYDEALRWYTQAAQQGHILAQRNLAALYDGGSGKARDTFKAFHWYQKAAQQGQPHSQLMSGMMYLYGSGTPQDSEKAKHWFEQAARSGEPNGQYMYGKIIFSQHPQEALHWFQRAAAQNNGYALYQLGLLHYLGEHLLENDEQAIAFAERSIQTGHQKAQLLKEKLLTKQQTTESTVSASSLTMHSSATEKTKQKNSDIEKEKEANASSPLSVAASHKVPTNTPTSIKPKADKEESKGTRWLLSQPEENYSIQLALMSSPSSITRFSRYYPTVEDTHSYASQFPKGTLYVLLKGSYSTFAEAKKAVDALPDKVKKTKPWIRQFRKLQTQYVKPE